MALSANRSTIPVLTLEEARRLIPNGRSVGTIQPLIANGEAHVSGTVLTIGVTDDRTFFCDGLLKPLGITNPNDDANVVIKLDGDEISLEYDPEMYDRDICGRAIASHRFEA